jgi:hypothetical protein
MCPTRRGRLETRTAIIIGPALLGLLLSIVTGKTGYIELIGIYYVVGVILDVAYYPFIFRWQPPWMTFVIAVNEFVIVFVIGKWVDVGLTNAEAVVFFWVSWAISIVTKIVVLPIASHSWIENGGEFRQTTWTIPAAGEPLPVDYARPGDADRAAGPPPLARAFSAVHEIPDEVKHLPSPSRLGEVRSPTG